MTVTLVDPQEALRALLLGDAIVKGRIVDRLYPFVLPQNERRESVTFTEISARGGYTTQGPDGLITARVQFNCFAPKADDARSLGLAVKASLDGIKGTIAGVDIKGIFFDDGRDLFDDDARLFYRSIDFTVWYSER